MNAGLYSSWRLHLPGVFTVQKRLMIYVSTLQAIRSPFLLGKSEDKYDRVMKISLSACEICLYLLSTILFPFWIVMLGTAQFFQYQYVTMHLYTDNFSDLMETA